MNATDWITPAVARLVELAIEEDLGRGDVTSEAIFGQDERPRNGVLIAKEPLVFCGGALVEAVFARVCREEVPIPYPRHLEEAALPHPEKIVAAVKAMF